MLSEYLRNNVKTHQDHWTAIFANGVRNATEEQYILLLNKLGTENDTIERHRLITALAYHSNIERIKQFLNSTVQSASPIFRTEDERFLAFAETIGVSQNHTAIGFDLLLDDLDSVNSAYGVSKVNDAIVRLSSFVVNVDHLAQVQVNLYVFKIYI